MKTRSLSALLAWLIFAALASVYLAACSSTGQQEFQRGLQTQLDNTDITGSVTGNGVTVTGGRVNGRNSVNVAVDAKQVTRAINAR